MAKKNKKSSKRNVKRVVAKRVNVVTKRQDLVLSNQRKRRTVIKNLILFFVLFAICLALYSFFTPDTMYSNLFGLLSILFGFIDLAFLIVLLALWFLNLIRK